MWNLIRRNTTRRRRAQTVGLTTSVACVIRQAETLENRALLTALIPKIALQQATILPSVNGRQLLVAENGASTDLYTTDGTQAGTIKFSTIPARLTQSAWRDSLVTNYAIAGQNLIFNAGSAIWKTDGISAAELMQTTSPSSDFVTLGSEVYFAASTAGSGRELWKTDGTSVSLVADLAPGTADSNPKHLKVFDGQLFFTASAIKTVYRTTGTSAGTVSVINGDVQYAPPGVVGGTMVVAVVNSKLVLKRESQAGGIELLAMDSATSTPTVFQHWTTNIVASDYSTFLVDGFAVAGSNVFFRRADTSSGRFVGELWKSNGTAAGTQMVSSTEFFNTHINKFGLSNSNIAFYGTNFGDVFIFRSGVSTWQTDGNTLLSFGGNVQRFVMHDGLTYSVTRGSTGSVLEYSSGPNSGHTIGGYYDTWAHHAASMLGSVWFVSENTIWKIEPNSPDAVPGPTTTIEVTHPNALGTTRGNGQDVFRISWNPVPGAVGYRINGVPSGTATSIDIPYVSDEYYVLNVQAILPSGQLSDASNFTFQGYLNSNNLAFTGTNFFAEQMNLRRDAGSTTTVYRAEIIDPVNGKVIQTIPEFRWVAGTNNVQDTWFAFPISKIPAHGRLTVRVLPSGIIASPNAASISFDLRYRTVSATASGAATTITWPSHANPDTGVEPVYDIWIDDTTRSIRQYIRNRNVLTNSFTVTLPNGTYKVWVGVTTAIPAAWSQPQLISVGVPPKLLSPIGTFLTPARVASFDWPVVRGATGYELWVNQIGGTSKIIHETALPGSSTFYRPSTPLPHGRYQAWIRSQGTGPGHGVWSAPINFTISPYPVLPVVATSEFDSTPTIKWTAPFAGIKYELWVGKADGTQAFRQNNIEATSFTLPTALAEGVYKISLRGQTSDGLMLPWSDQERVSMRIFPLKGPVIPQFAGNRSFTWNAVDRATQYDIWVNYLGGSQPAQSQIYRNENATGTSIELPSSLPAGNYRIWMRAIRIDGGITFMTDWTPNAPTFSII